MNENCVLCGLAFRHYNAHHNAQPLAGGDCCTTCNESRVIPERLRLAADNRKAEERKDG